MLNFNKYIVRAELGRGWPMRLVPAQLFVEGEDESIVAYKKGYSTEMAVVNNDRIFDSELDADALYKTRPLPRMRYQGPQCFPGDYVAWRAPDNTIRHGTVYSYAGGGAYYRIMRGSGFEEIKPHSCILLWRKERLR